MSIKSQPRRSRLRLPEEEGVHLEGAVEEEETEAAAVAQDPNVVVLIRLGLPSLYSLKRNHPR
jgi:hypothetical protein